MGLAPLAAEYDRTEEFTWPQAKMLAEMGFLGPEPELLDKIGVQRDARGNIKDASPYASSAEGIFAAGDARRGQSLIVWAINEGRQCARMVDRYLSARRNGRAGGVRGAIAVAEDAGLAGHASADGWRRHPDAHSPAGRDSPDPRHDADASRRHAHPARDHAGLYAYGSCQEVA